MEIQEPLPHWASALAFGMLVPNSALPTRDGRRYGNAVIVDTIYKHDRSYFRVVSDAGNLMLLTANEITELFYPPEYVMRDLLRAHKIAIARDNTTRALENLRERGVKPTMSSDELMKLTRDKGE